MDVPGQATLRMREIEHIGIGGDQAGCGRIGVARVVGQEEVLLEPQQRRVAPEARVKFLGVHQDELGIRHGIRRRLEVADVRDPLLLVDDEVFDDVEALRPGPGT